MKRIFLLVLAVSLLLIGCGRKQVDETTPILSTQATTEASTEPTLPFPAPDGAFTVYLLERVEYLDGEEVAFTTTYTYDECGNVLTAVQKTAAGEVQCTTYYEEQDENGMPHKIREVWDAGNSTPRVLTYLEDGRIESELYEGHDNSGWWYEYDEQGNLSQMRLYYENSLDLTVFCEYEGEIKATGTDRYGNTVYAPRTLSAVYCESGNGIPYYDTELLGGKILKKDYHVNAGYSYTYEYDENGNLTAKSYQDAEAQWTVTRYVYTEAEISGGITQYVMAQHEFLMGFFKGDP